ncbi:MAG: hypothetical protein ACYTGC_14685, partial [Planctomycetota bacterium]
ENPFVDPSDPSSGLDEQLLDQWAGWLERLDESGVVVYLFLYDDGADPYAPRGWLARLWARLTGGGTRMGSDEERFVRDLVDRFEAIDNLVWVVAEEYDEALTRRRVSEIAATIRDADDRDHPIAVHQQPGLIFHFADDPHVDEFAMQFGTDQTSPRELHGAVVRARRLAADRHSVVMSEVPYGGVGRDAAARRKVWAMAMGNAWVLVNGWHIDTTPPERLAECGHLVRFLARAGAPDLASHDELAHGATSYVLARPPDRYLAYSARPGQIGLRDLPAGTYEPTWLDAVTGEVVEQPARRVDAETTGWTRPPGVGEERVLFLVRVETSE